MQPEDYIDLSRPFVLSEKQGRVRVAQGESYKLENLDDIHLLSKKTQSDVAFVLPYRCIRERGFEAKGDEPVLALAISSLLEVKTFQFLDMFPVSDLDLEQEVTPSLSDEEYIKLVEEFQKNEIEAGNASQTTLSRRFEGKIRDFSLQKAFSIFKRLSERTGHYMAVLYADINTREPEKSKYILGATPERHLTISGNETLMIPIAGTLRKEDKKTFAKRLKAFVEDPKEINELFQVVDEEMKIMGHICPDGGTVEGPFLREIGAVIHSEYRLVGKRGKDSIQALRHTLHAPTVVGSPMESAARIIAKYEPVSRRYYGGEFGYYSEPRTKAPNGDLDTAILLRCSEIEQDGRFIVQAGGGLVRDSNPESEAHESSAKAKGFTDILTGDLHGNEMYLTPRLYKQIQAKLEDRNKTLAPFWLNPQSHQSHLHDSLKDLQVSIVNNEDNFAYMIAHMVKSFGARVSIHDTFDFNNKDIQNDIVILGPGPGDPNDLKHPRIARLHSIARDLKQADLPVLGICLGHQILSIQNNIEVRRQTRSTQGMQKRVRSFNKESHLGFYNSFSPVLSKSTQVPPEIRIDLDEEDRIIAMQGPGMIGFQYHPESIMSQNGDELLYKALVSLWYAL